MATIFYEDLQESTRRLANDKVALREFLEQYIDEDDAAAYSMYFREWDNGQREFGPTFQGLLELLTSKGHDVQSRARGSPKRGLLAAIAPAGAAVFGALKPSPKPSRVQAAQRMNEPFGPSPAVVYTPSQLHNELWDRAADEKSMRDFMTDIFSKLNANEQVREKEIEQFTGMFNHARLDGVSEKSFKSMAGSFANYLQRYRAIESDRPEAPARRDAASHHGPDDAAPELQKKGFLSRKWEQAKQMREDDANKTSEEFRKGVEERKAKQEEKARKKQESLLAASLARGSGQSAPKASQSSVSIFSILFDLVDGIPVAGDFIVLAANIIQCLRALFSGHISTAFLMALVTAFDFFLGVILETIPFVGNIGDVIFPSVTINRYLLARAQASVALPGMASDEDATSLFMTESGEPTTLAVFIFLAAVGIPIYALWIGEPLGALVSLVLLVLLFLNSAFREEFTTPAGMMFLITMAIHIVWHSGLFGGPGLAFSTGTLILNLMLYTVITVVYAFMSGHLMTNMGRGAVISIVAILLYALPGVATQFVSNDILRSSFTVIALIAPVWPLSMLMQLKQDFPGGFGAKTLRALVAFLLAIGLFLLISVMPNLAAIIPDFSTSSADTRGDTSTFFGSLKTRWTQTVGRVGSVYDRATNPGAYYTGQVEKNKKEPLGVTLENFRPQDRTINNGSDIIMHGVVKAKSFLGTSLVVQPSCVIDRPGAPEAEVDPPVTEVVFGSSQAFSCTFPNMTTGSYSVKGAATFPFETWSYISYTFVDDERVRNLARQGLDVNTEFDIPEEPTAVFTSGPIKVGMGGSSMPILVRSEEPLLQPGTKIGITVDPAWEAGKLQRVERIELKVPSPFEIPLDKDGKALCDRELSQPPQQDIYDPAYTTYVFQNPEFGPVVTYTSVTCSLSITDPAAATSLVRENDKAVRSFIAVVKYTYTVEQTGMVQVQ